MAHTQPDFSLLKRILEQDDPAAAEAFFNGAERHDRDEGLAEAVEAGATKVALKLLASGADPNASIPSALVRAITARRHGLFDTLLEAGADLGSYPWWEDGDHPLTSAAVIADPIAMRWLCEAGSVDISDPEWLWDAVSQIATSRKKTALETMLILVPALLNRLDNSRMQIDVHALNKAAGRLRREAKKSSAPEARELASALAGLSDEVEADEDEILALIQERCFGDILTFVHSAQGPRHARRAGLALLWGIRSSAWVKEGKNYEQVPDPDGIAYLDKLLGLDADVDIRDPRGRTALMYAVRKLKPEIADKLVELGANLYAVDHEGAGRSVLGWAKASAEPEKMVAWVERAMKKQAENSLARDKEH